MGSSRLGTKETFSVDLYNVVIANGRFAAGGLPIAPNADPSDGLLDIILIPERPGSEITLLVAKIILGNHLDAVTFRRAAKSLNQIAPRDVVHRRWRTDRQ